MSSFKSASPDIASLAVLFADISDSTKLYEILGDVAARKLIARCLDALGFIVQKHQGVVIKTIGDELMSTFPSADHAIEAAIDMQKHLNNSNTIDHALLSGLSIRIGFHYGSVIKEAGDIFGDAVNIAARVAAMAKKQQILMTGTTLGVLSNRPNTRFLERVLVKGKSQPIDIYEINWEAEGVSTTYTANNQPAEADNDPNCPSLRLRYSDKTFLLDEAHPMISIGRSQKNDITIEDDVISRHHAHLEYYRGEFFLVDKSANGTFISPRGGNDQVFLHRSSILLQGKGSISLGKPVSMNAILLHFFAS